MDDHQPVSDASTRDRRLGALGKSGWADLVLTGTSTLNGGGAQRKPLRVREPYDGRTCRLDAFNIACERRSK